MRVFAASAAVALCAACGPSDVPPPAVPSTPSSRAVSIDLGGVARVRGDLPAGYEIGELAGRVAPLAFWGFGPQWVADPPECGVLADPPVDGATVRGWSASGSGGIVYVVAAAAPVALDPAVLGECANSTLTAGHTSGTVATVGAPTIDGATTLGLRTESATVVEGGTETHSAADTFIAYLDGYVAYVTVVTDPGSAGQALDEDFAAGLLVKTVSALHG